MSTLQQNNWLLSWVLRQKTSTYIIIANGSKEFTNSTHTPTHTRLCTHVEQKIIAIAIRLILSSKINNNNNKSGNNITCMEKQTAINETLANSKHSLRRFAGGAGVARALWLMAEMALLLLPIVVVAAANNVDLIKGSDNEPGKVKQMEPLQLNLTYLRINSQTETAAVTEVRKLQASCA